MRRQLELRMAMPSKGEYETLIQFMQGLEQILNYNLHPDDIEAEEPRRQFLRDCEMQDWIVKHWLSVDSCWQRVLMAGQVAIDNACDPNLDHLDFKPEIKRAVESHEELLKALEELLEWGCTYTGPNDPYSPHDLLVQAQAAIAKAKGKA